MTTSEQISAQSIECIELLTECNRLYSLMLETLEQLSKSHEATSDVQLLARNQQFNALQSLIAEHDERLSAQLLEIDISLPPIKQLLDTRMELLLKVRSQNKVVATQVEAIKSLLANEIRTFKAGHTALQGYRAGEQSRQTNYFKGTF
jgi:glutathionylspermidine synthase